MVCDFLKCIVGFGLLIFFKTFFLIFIYLFIFMAVLGLRFCARAFSSCGKRGPLFIVGRRPLTITASLVAEHRLQTRRLSSCGARAQLLRGMWDLPRPGLEPMSPALAGRFSTTAPPGKPWFANILLRIFESVLSVILACNFLSFSFFFFDIFVLFLYQGDAGLID